MSKGGGIRFQLIAGMVVMTLAGIGLIGVLSIKIVERSALMWAIGQAEKTAGFVRASLVSQPGAAQSDARLSQALLREALISDYRLFDSDGRAVVSAGFMPPDGGELIYEDESMRAYRYGGGFLGGVGDLIRVSAPLSGGKRVEFTQSLADVKEDMAGVRRFLVLYALLDSVVIIAFGAYFLSRSILQPLRKLEEAATRIAGGKLFERADVAVDNEVGRLASSFNSMAARLEEEIRSLERVNIELVTAQDELLRNRTLAALGRLAAGIAHEIGNPLGALGGYMELLSRGGLDPEENKEIAGRASREIGRIDSIVREFLEVARPAKRAPEAVPVNDLVSDTLASLSVRPDFAGVEASFVPGKGLAPVMADEGKLRQVFMNILINAAQAMEGMEKKSIKVETLAERRPVELRAGRRRDDPPSGPAPGREFVLVRFTDSGRGVGPDDAARIFDPFFTTKDVGKGTGLGLFVSQSIIRAYGGEITCRDAGNGAEFTVELPAAEGAA